MRAYESLGTDIASPMAMARQEIAGMRTLSTLVRSNPALPSVARVGMTASLWTLATRKDIL